MSIKLAKGFLPYIYKLDPNGFEGTNIGRQRGFFVTVKHDGVPLLKHEEHHVAQFYFQLLVLLVMMGVLTYTLAPLWAYALPSAWALLNLVPWFNYRKEVSAYAVSVRYGRELESAATALGRNLYVVNKGGIDKAKADIQGRSFLGLF